MVDLRAVNPCMAWPYSCYLAKCRRERACTVILAFPMQPNNLDYIKTHTAFFYHLSMH